MLDDRVRAVLARLEQQDAEERELGLPPAERGRAVARTTGEFLFALVAPQWDCEVLEIGGSRGYSTIWLAAGVRYLGGRVLSLESDPRKIAAWRANIAEAGLEDWADLIEGDAAETIPAIEDVFDVVGQLLMPLGDVAARLGAGLDLVGVPALALRTALTAVVGGHISLPLLIQPSP